VLSRPSKSRLRFFPAPTGQHRGISDTTLLGGQIPPPPLLPKKTDRVAALDFQATTLPEPPTKPHRGPVLRPQTPEDQSSSRVQKWRRAPPASLQPSRAVTPHTPPPPLFMQPVHGFNPSKTATPTRQEGVISANDPPLALNSPTAYRL